MMLFCGVTFLVLSAEDDEEVLLKKYKHNKYLQANKKLKKYTKF
jgi:hypothetical protein